MAEQPGGEWTKIPNAILDAMPKMGDAELRVVLAILRKTTGWQKECDVISLTQLEHMTGLGRRHIIKALNTALANGWIDREPAKRNGFCYRLVTLGNQSDGTTSNLGEPALVTLGNQSSPQLVTLGNTQKKESKETSSMAAHVAFLIDQGMGAATEFRDLEPDVAIADFKRRVKEGQSIAQIVRAWRAKAPIRKPAQNGTGPPPSWRPPDALPLDEAMKRIEERKR